MTHSVYACIDLKSFYASVECIERGLDPFKTNLVVADPDRSSGTICLAITPAMKELGIKNRCRVYEIPKNIPYIMAQPRMRLYMQKSAEIFSIYQRYISAEDIHVYSVDECFLDFTPYLSLYHLDATSMAKKLMHAVYRQTGICATAGVGTNLFLAKVALDILAKHAPDYIGTLDSASFREKIWYHQPITDIWNIGVGIARRLEKYGITDLHGITMMPEETLYREFGTNASFLINHAYGEEPSTIHDIHQYRPKSRSISHTQVLFRNYSFDEAELVFKEMIHQTVLELVEAHCITGRVSLYIGYANEMSPQVISRKLSLPTASEQELMDFLLRLYQTNVDKSASIRRIGLALGDLSDESERQISLFTDIQAEEKEQALLRTLVRVKNRYGSNAVLKGYNYLSGAMARERNGMIGGHHA